MLMHSTLSESTSAQNNDFVSMIHFRNVYAEFGLYLSEGFVTASYLPCNDDQQINHGAIIQIFALIKNGSFQLLN